MTSPNDAVLALFLFAVAALVLVVSLILAPVVIWARHGRPAFLPARADSLTDIASWLRAGAVNRAAPAMVML